jgi:hypothetical protein
MLQGGGAGGLMSMGVGAGGMCNLPMNSPNVSRGGGHAQGGGGGSVGNMVNMIGGNMMGGLSAEGEGFGGGGGGGLPGGGPRGKMSQQVPTQVGCTAEAAKAFA